MSHSLHFDGSAGCFIHSLSGIISIEDVLAASLAQANHPDHHARVAAIWDVREADLSLISRDAVRTYAGSGSSVGRQEREDRIVIVVASRHDYAIARQMLGYMDWPPALSHISYDIDDAFTWLANGPT